MRVIFGVLLAMTFTAGAWAQTGTPAGVAYKYPNKVLQGLREHPEPRGYEGQVLALKARMERLARKDGGHLTAEHQASLQRDLDRLNRDYGMRRASSGTTL